MTASQLVNMGFRKKKIDGEYWYELSYRGHKFITNDTLRNNGKDNWFVGYQTKWDNDGFWFNEKLKDEGVFRVVFHLLTGSELKLAHQRNLVNKT